MINALAIFGLLAALMPGSLASAFRIEPDVPEMPVIIDVVDVLGSGCPAGSVSVDMNPDYSSFVVRFNAFSVRVGVDARPTDFRKNCQVGIAVHSPSGYTYAISQVSYQGYAYLEKGASSQLRTSHYFRGQNPTPARTMSFVGPMDDEWTATDLADIDSVYAPCGESSYLTTNTELRVTAGTSDVKTTSSYMTLNQLGDYKLSWKRCA